MLPFKKIFTALAFAGAVMASPMSYASAVINSAFIPGLNTVQDSNADRIVRSGSVITTGTFQVGDVFESILRFDTVNSQAINSAVGTLNYGLWAYAAVSISTLVAVDTNGDSVNDAFSITFAAAIPSNPGVMIELYEANSSTNFLGQAAATGISGVRALTKVAEFGQLEAGDFWSATIPQLVQNLSLPLGSGQQPSGVLGLSLLSNAGNLPIGKNGILSPISGLTHDIVGDLSAFSRENGVDTGWIVSTNTNISFNTPVPEPSTLSLMGAAVLLGGMAKRRRSV